MIVVTTITSTVDVDTMVPDHSVDINDVDGLSEVSRDVLGAVVLGGIHATDRAVRKEFPRVNRLDTHTPTRNSDVEAWIKRARDEQPGESEGWLALDGLLDNYRLAADTGQTDMNQKEEEN